MGVHQWSVKLIDLAGLALPGYYNASKIKHYDYVREHVSTPNMSPTEAPVDLNQDLFEAPVVGSVELIEEYDKLWAAVLDDTQSSASSDSMITVLEDWTSDWDAQDESLRDQLPNAIDIQEGDILQEPAICVAGTMDEYQLARNNGSEVTSSTNGEEMELGEVGTQEQEKEIPGKGSSSNLITWFIFKISQCMYAMWINGTINGALNTLKFDDENEQSQLWKNLALKQLLGKWRLQVKLAKMTAYIDNKFTTSNVSLPAQSTC